MDASKENAKTTSIGIRKEKESDFEEAKLYISWGSFKAADKYGLTPEEMHRAVLEVLEDIMRNGTNIIVADNYENPAADEIIRHYGITKAEATEVAKKAYERMMRSHLFLDSAAKLAREFNLGDKKVRNAAVKNVEILLTEQPSGELMGDGFEAEVLEVKASYGLRNNDIKEAAYKAAKTLVGGRDYEKAAIAATWTDDEELIKETRELVRLEAESSEHTKKINNIINSFSQYLVNNMLNSD